MGSETRARLALAGLLAATLLSFELVFVNAGYAGPALLACALAMGVGVLGRRWGAGPILTFEISLAALFWYLAVVFQASKTLYGLPTPSAATGIARLVSAALDASVVDFAPVPVRAGYVIMIVVGFWLTTTIAEITAFRWRRPVLASLAPLALFAIGTITGTGRGTGFYLTIFLVALLTFWGMESSHRLRSWGRWVSTWDHHRAREPEQVTSALARRMGASCIAATLIAPLFLPTLGDGWLPWRNDTGGGLGGGGEVNLLVDIAPRYLEQSETELFQVSAEQAAYWRLTSLVRYDGRLWHKIDEARATADDTRSFDDETHNRLVQDIQITGLEGRHLPAAVEPTTVEDEDVRWSDESVDLTVEDDLTEGTSYKVTSAVPDLEYEELNEADVASPPDPEYLKTGEISPEVDALLKEWTAGAETPFEQLVAIQSRLRSAIFTYSTDVEPTDSDDYLDEFLLETKTGFCQQFSTAFALLARALDMPTRISVGFLPGTADPATGIYTVRGTDAHAWPEVKFEDFGWVAFEPTARAISTQPTYTIAPIVPNLRGGETDVGGGNRGPGEAGERVRRLEDPAGRARPERTPRAPVEDTAWQSAFSRLALVILAAILVWAIAVPLLKTGRSKRRFRRAATPAATTIAAFRQFEDDAAEMFGPRRPAESVAAYARRIGDEAHRVPPSTVERLAMLYELAAYSPVGVTQQQAAEARRRAKELGAALWSRSTPWQKALRLFSVRSLLSGVDLRLRPGRGRARPIPG